MTNASKPLSKGPPRTNPLSKPQTTLPQAQALPLEKRLYRAGQHVVRAGLFLDLWFYFEEKLGLVAFLLHPISWCHCRTEVSLKGAMQRFEFSRWRRHSTNFDIRGATAHDVMTLGIH